MFFLVALVLVVGFQVFGQLAYCLPLVLILGWHFAGVFEIRLIFIILRLLKSFCLENFFYIQ